METLLYDWQGLNAHLFHIINDVRHPWLDIVMLHITELSEHAWQALFFIAYRRTRHPVPPSSILRWCIR